MTRPLIVGPDTPEPPFPFVVNTQITSGFGRGSSELGIPTANIPPGELAQLDPGVYYGWARVSGCSADKDASMVKKSGTRDVSFNYGKHLQAEDQLVYPMVMSIGWNPFFKNKEKSAEVHIIHKFADLFYGANISVVVAGFIRAEQSYESLDALIADIKFDIDVAQHSLEREKYKALQKLVT